MVNKYSTDKSYKYLIIEKYSKLFNELLTNHTSKTIAEHQLKISIIKKKMYLLIIIVLSTGIIFEKKHFTFKKPRYTENNPFFD